MRRSALMTVLTLAAMTGCTETPAADTTVATVAVNTAKASTGDFPVKRTYPAIATPVWQVDIIARVEGWLEDRNFLQGHRVEENDLLFVIQQESYEAAVLAAKAAIAEAKAEANLARIIVGRNRPLVATGAIAAEEFDQYVANFEVALAEVESAEADLIQADLNLSYTEILAPISGRIGATSIDPGTMIIPGTDAAQLCTLIMTDPIRVNFAPSANEYPEYLEKWMGGQPLHAVITNPRKKDWNRNGTISFVDNTADPTTSLIRMWTDVPNDPETLLPGQYCEATVTLDVLKDVVTIPSDALVQVSSSIYVWKVGTDDTVTQTQVKVTMQQDGTAVLESGIKAGDRIVVQGVDKIRFNGTKITEAPPPPPPGTPPPDMTAADTDSNSSDSKAGDSESIDSKTSDSSAAGQSD